MKHNADARCRGQAEGGRKAERVKEGQYSHDAIVGVQHKDLVELLDVGGDVVVREDDAFGVAGRAAGKNDRGDIVERRRAVAARKFRQAFRWQ